MPGLGPTRPSVQPRRHCGGLRSKNLPDIQADPYRLEQVFLNIISNAGDALQEVEGHRGQLGVRVRRKADWLLIELTDNDRASQTPTRCSTRSTRPNRWVTERDSG